METATASKIVELRQYTLVPGTTSEFVQLFEDELFTAQEAVGMRLLGLFTRPDDSDKFVWLRGFPSRAVRKAALEEFYYGPVWRKYGRQANAMMIDSDDVHMLRPSPGLPSVEDLIAEPLASDSTSPFALTVVRAEIWSEAPSNAAVLETEPTPNDFPQLPVHDTSVCVTLRRLNPTEPIPPGGIVLTPTRRSRLK